LDPTVVALIGTLFGGVGLKAIEHWLGKNKVKVDDAARLRDELRLEVTALRAENQQLENDVDKWREDYYKMYADFVQVKTDLQLMQGMMESQLPRPPPE
jgi:outer membrane murein-binding lipoprotein Lpp